MPGPRTARAIALALAVVTAAGCSAPVRDYSCDDVPDVVAASVDAVWRCNRDVMVRAARKKKFSLREFRSASEFFETLTGIAPDTRASRQGPLPGPGLGANIEAWDRWYATHRDRLRWDAADGSVRLGPGS